MEDGRGLVDIDTLLLEAVEEELVEIREHRSRLLF